MDSSENDDVVVSAASTSPRTQQASKMPKTLSQCSGERAAEEGDRIDGIVQVSMTVERPGAQSTQQGRSRFSGDKNILQSEDTAKPISSRETRKADRSVRSTHESNPGPDAAVRGIIAAAVLKSLESSIQDKLAAAEDFAKVDLTAPKFRDVVKPDTTPEMALSPKDFADRTDGKAKAVASRSSKEIQQDKALKSMVSSEDEFNKQVKSSALRSSKDTEQGKIMKDIEADKTAELTPPSKGVAKPAEPRSLKEMEADKATELTALSKSVAEPAAPGVSKDIEAGEAAEMTATCESFDAVEAAESDIGTSSVTARQLRDLQTGKMAAAKKATESGREVKSDVPRSSKEIEHERTMKFESFSDEAETEVFMPVGPQVSLEAMTDKSVNFAALTKHFEKTKFERSEKSAVESDSIKSEPNQKDRRVVLDALGKVAALEAEKSPGVVYEDLVPELKKNIPRDGEFKTVKESSKASDAVQGKDVQPEGNISPDFAKRLSGEYDTETAELATQPSTGDLGEETSFEEDESLSKEGLWVELQEIEGEKQLKQQREDTESHKLGIVRDGARDGRSEVRQSATRHLLEFVDGQSEFGQGDFRPVSADVARLSTRGGVRLSFGRLAQKSLIPDSVDFKPRLSYPETIEGVQGRPVAELQRESEKQRRMSISISSLKTGRAFRTSEQRSYADEDGEGPTVVSQTEECLLLKGIGLPSKPSLLRRLDRTADVSRGPLDPEFDRGGLRGLLHEDLEFKRTSMEHYPGDTRLRPCISSPLPHKTLQVC